MTLRRDLTVLVALLALGVTACGDGSDAKSGAPPRTVEVSMVDNEFAPATLDVEEGETVRFVFTNDGTVDHEAIIGTAEDQEDHEAEMDGGDSHDGMSGMDHGEEGDDDAVAVAPGETGELTYTFGKDEELIIGCHEPGHYEAGMLAKVEVS